jgi:zinc/manganese transport system substrate-binding protein
MVRTSSEETNMNAKLKFVVVLLSLSCMLPAASAGAALNVFACEPEWGALVQELAGDKANVFTATTALQDPHRIEARPSLIARTRSADIVVCTGADLEAGWLPLLLTQAGNSRIQTGAPGFFEASRFAVKLEIPTSIDRSLGDVHPSGNPHIHLDPRNILRVATALSERLSQIDASNAETYKQRLAAFRDRWTAAMARWEQQGARLKGVPIVVYHRDMSYFINWMGMREVGSLEPKPGLPATPAHLNELVQSMKRDPAKAIVYSAYNSARPAEFLAERTNIPMVLLPFTVGGTDKAKDLFGLFDDTITRLLATVK